MIAQGTLDWPLSREEKKHRLLQLYDTDLRAADSILQSSRLHASPDLQDNDENNKMKVMPKTFIPGAIEDKYDASVLNSEPIAPSIAQPMQQTFSQLAPRVEVGYSVGSSPLCSSARLAKDRLDKARGVVEIGRAVSSSSPPGIRPHEKSAADGQSARSTGQSSNGGQSARSFEYLTPESVPRTPPGFNSTNMPRTIHVQPPFRAPMERPPSTAGKDVYYCDKTATVIPAIPPMPPPPRLGDRRRNSAGIPAMPTQVLQDIRNLPKRPKSAAAASREYDRCGDLRRRRSLSKERNKIDAFQTLSSVRHGKYEEVEMALAAGFGVNCADTHGNTVFHVACQNGRKRIAKLAVKCGADIDAQNAKGNTGLHFLYAYGYPDIADYFIGKGAREDIRNDAGKVAREGIR